MIQLVMQASGGAAPGGAFVQLLPLIMIGLIFYFLLIRPQNQRMKKHKEMLAAVQRGDEVVTNGGLIGKVTKAGDGELTIDLGEGQKVKVVRTMIADVRNRPQPANDRPAKSKK
ncbi:MAG: preprotein translocase subunit YajC [Maricaulaceae bacterium]